MLVVLFVLFSCARRTSTSASAGPFFVLSTSSAHKQGARGGYASFLVLGPGLPAYRVPVLLKSDTQNQDGGHTEISVVISLVTAHQPIQGWENGGSRC